MTVARGGEPGVAPRTRAGVVRVVLVGFMGAGKSTVGPIVARALGWGFVDLDDEIERREGRPAGEMIREGGLARFRRIESQVGRDVLRRARVVVAAGGGWAAEPGHMAALGRHSISVWLRVSPETALVRIEGSAASRPLLEGPEPRASAEALLGSRTAHYRQSDIIIDTEGRTPDQVARAILEHPLLVQSEQGGV